MCAITLPSREPLGLRPGAASPRLFDRTVEVLRTKRYSPRTEKTYLGWIRRFIEFHGGRHPLELGVADVNAFISNLATNGKVSASTQNIALAAVLFLYKHVLKAPLDRVEGIVRAKKPKSLPVVLSRGEVAAVIGAMSGVPKLIAMLQYGTGARLSEALSVRVKDIDFVRGELIIRRGKGGSDRMTMLPRSLEGPLTEHLNIVRAQHEADLAAGLGRVPMPEALARKYPNADREWGWQWVFPATSHFTDRETRVRYRWHLHDSVVQKAVRAAARQAGITKRVKTHSFRHSFATHLLEDGYDIRTVQELLGHASVKTTMIYTHVLNRGGFGVTSPLDRMAGLGPPSTYPDRENFLKDR